MMREEWIECTLDDVIQIMKNGSSAEQFNEKVGFPITRIETISNEFVDLNKVKYVKEKNSELIDKHALKYGDLLLSHINSDSHLGKTAIYKNQTKILIHGINLLLLRPYSIIIPDFLNYQFKHQRAKGKFIEIAQRAVNQSSINQRKLKMFSILLAPLPEQQAIVAKIEKLFSDIDNGVANLKAAKDKLEIYRQAVFKKAFEGEFTRPHEITWITIDEICDDVQYGTSSKSLELGEIPVIRMGNIQNGKLDWSDLVYTSDKNEIEKYKLNYNDVLFNRTNSPELVGKTAIYKGEFPAIFAGYLIRINYKKSEVNPDYLTYFLNCHIAKKYGNKIKSDGVNQSNINGTKLKQYPFPNTKLEVQKQIVYEIETRLSVCDNILATIDEALEESEALRQSVLKKAFEGRLLDEAELEACRKEADWEPADRLLERIRKEKEAKR